MTSFQCFEIQRLKISTMAQRFPCGNQTKQAYLLLLPVKTAMYVEVIFHRHAAHSRICGIIAGLLVVRAASSSTSQTTIMGHCFILERVALVEKTTPG